MKHDTKTADTVASTLIQAMERRAADPRSVWGLPYFCPGLNALTGGAHRGEMSLLGARTSVGKSFWLAQDALHKAKYLLSDEGQRCYPGQCVKLVLCEMSAEQFEQRIVVQLAEVSDRKVRSGTLSLYEQERYRTAAKQVGELPIEYLDRPQGLEHTLQWLSNGTKCAWFGVDYIGIHPTGDGQLDASPYRKVSYLSAGFRDYCFHGPPGLILAQLNREIDKRKPEDRRPMLSDFRDSGQLEQDASGATMALFRPDLYTKVPDEDKLRPKPADLIVMKQRNGPIGTVELMWLPSLPGYADVSDRYDEEEQKGAA